jgi:hypothetical protein
MVTPRRAPVFNEKAKEPAAWGRPPKCSNWRTPRGSPGRHRGSATMHSGEMNAPFVGVCKAQGPYVGARAAMGQLDSTCHLGFMSRDSHPYIMENKKCSKPPTSHQIYTIDKYNQKND